MKENNYFDSVCVC